MDHAVDALLWKPDSAKVSSANISEFARFFLTMANEPLDSDYRGLQDASVRHPGAFWTAVWEFSGCVGERGNRSFIPGTTIRDTQWFPEAKINFAEIMLKPAQLDDFDYANGNALVAINEKGERTCLTRRELTDQVCKVAAFLRSKGVNPGDRVVAVIPNVAEAVIAHLATAAIGAVWSSCSPDFGEDAICDRFGQIEPKLIITSSECRYAGKSIRPSLKVARVLERLPTIETVVVVGPRHGIAPTLFAPLAQLVLWNDLPEPPDEAFVFERFPFDHPLCILYSSGTTGIPKCIVHGVGGTVLQHAKEHLLHCDLKPGDTLFYYTTTGWMMWNWLLSALGSGATILLFDGSPFASGPQTLWEIAQQEGVSHFGASPRYYRTVEKEEYVPAEKMKLSRLRCVLSTGSPLLPESFDWIYRSVSPSVVLASISGGTDILSCFVLGNPTLPVYRGQIQCKGLGMDVQVFDELGKKVIGQPGELVCASPFPSMPIRFWNDPEGRKYHAAYFDRFDGVWCHGDWAQEESTGGFVIFGRSDATLNPGGVRIGTAEIYQQVEAFPEIVESLATVLRSHGDERIVLFVKMCSGQKLTPALAAKIRQRLKDNCSPRHAPEFIDEAPDFPRTISGKLSEIAVRSAINASNLGNSGALANPECLTFFSHWRPGGLLPQ